MEFNPTNYYFYEASLITVKRAKFEFSEKHGGIV